MKQRSDTLPAGSMDDKEEKTYPKKPALPVFSGRSHSCKMIESDILIDLAGRAATELVLGQLDIGCSDDIDHAVGHVENLVSGLYGAKFGWGRRESELYLGIRDQNIYKAMEGYYQKAKEIVAENRSFLDALIEELLQKTILTYKDIAIIKENAN